MRTRVFTSAMVSYSASPVYWQARVRPWMAISWMPDSSAMRAMIGAFLLALFQPVRNLSVTGCCRRRHDGLEDAGDQRLVLHQRGAGHHVADLLGRAAHVDVDDLGAAVDVVAGGLGHHGRIGAGDLHGDRVNLAVVVGAPLGLGAAVEQGVGGDHLGDGEPAPIFLQSWRKGRSVTPAMGATNRLFRKVNPANCIGEARLGKSRHSTPRAFPRAGAEVLEGCAEIPDRRV
jgi:hypothetical protein